MSIDLHTTRLAALHALAQKRGLQFKIAAFFAGREAQCLADAYGETRGRHAENEKADTVSVIPEKLPLSEFLETKLGLHERTARRYRNFYLSLATTAPELAKKLNAHYDTALKTAPQLTDGEQAETALAAAPALTEKILREICDTPDEWGLEELFAKPAPAIEADGSDDTGDSASDRKAQRDALIKWALQTMRRFESKDILRLPRPQLEAFVTITEDTLKRAREELQRKAPKAKAKAKSKTKARTKH